MLPDLRKFINSRPGFELANYDRASYLQDSKRVQRQRQDALAMLRYCELFEIAPDYSAFSGRLTPTANGFDYCTGQYYCTEYRAAACACLASGIWQYLRDKGGCTTGDQIRKVARQEFGRGIASRWFN
jgi:hypothetical protein